MVPTYHATWFNPSNFIILAEFKHKPNINFLEIGSFEGMGTNYFVNTFLAGDNCFITCVDPWIKYSDSTITKMNGYDDLINENTYEIFLKNIERNKNKIIINRGLSTDILPTLDAIYDFIYIDGDHSEHAVWNDAVNSFKILKNYGIIIFDDYLWNDQIDMSKSPKNAIDKFLVEYKPYIEIIKIDYQVIIRKIADL